MIHSDAKGTIARRVAQELKNDDVVNLGIGLPTLALDYLDENVNVILHSENGFIGLGPVQGIENSNLVNAGGQFAGIVSGGSTFDSAMSFALVRGGHIHVTVLGALQVDVKGNLANWMVPGKMIPGMGGAMDLVVGAKKVIIAMEHCCKDGSPKILNHCTLPLTGKGVVNMLITELAVFTVQQDGLMMDEITEGINIEYVQARMEAPFSVNPNLKVNPVFLSHQ
ncbi:3-oxoacid CoA-transferase subunit B [Pelosinus sp. sgz500959]|uniref:3-oxoacid CoA-transferase subunit B n=1 Tax=Pelosinus sp. sgz500959 TaxID=3242472 RepID=UPI00366E693B